MDAGGLLLAMDQTLAMDQALTADAFALDTVEHVPGWGYLLLFAVAAAQFVPNGSLVMAAAALAGQGRMSLPLVVLAVLGGLLCGDLLVHGLVRRARNRGPGRHLHRLPRALRVRCARLLRNARTYVHRNGVGMVLTLRFVPGGRAAGAAAAGLGDCPALRYFGAAALAEITWATLYLTLGYTGGKLSPSPYLSVAVALLLGCALTSLGLLLRNRRRTASAASAAASAEG